MEQKTLLIAIALAGALYIVGQHVSSDPVRDAGNALTVQATGKAQATPNIAHVVLGVRVEPQATSQDATDMLATRANAVIDAVEKSGITKEDIATQNFSVQPTYNYDNGKQTLKGYEGSQQLDVTVRATDKAGLPAVLAGDVIARATEAGANQIGGVSFKNDDPEVAQLSAEQDAIANARTKAEALAKSLGVHLGKVKNYNAQQNYGAPIPYALEAKAIGGDASVESPRLPAGTQESMVTVTITYELR